MSASSLVDGTPSCFGVDERHIEAGLAEQGERAEDLEAVLRHVVEQSEDLLALALQVRLVDLLVLGAEVELEDLLLFVRQVAGHLLFGAPQHEGADSSTKLGQSLGVVSLFDGHPVVLGESVGIGEQARERQWRATTRAP